MLCAKQACALPVLVLIPWGIVILTGCSRSPEGLSAKTNPELAAPASPPASSVVLVPPDSPQAKQLRIDAVKAQPVPVEEVAAPARIVMNPNRISRVLPPVQGRVVSVAVKLGDSVIEGQTLATVDSPDADMAIANYLQAEAAVRQAKAAVSKTQAEAQRAKNLLPFQGISERDAQAAANDFAAAQSSLESAQATREQALRKLTLLGFKFSDLKQPYIVRAPIAGVVTELNVAPGDYRAAVASPGDIATPMMSIADLSTVWVACDVPEPSIRLVQVGDSVSINLVAYPGEKFTGRVSRRASTLDPQTRTLKVHVELPNPQRRFVPEMFGAMRHLGPAQMLPVVSSSAIVQEYGRSEVFVERQPGQFERRVITTGFRTRDTVGVTSGLQVNERVVMDGAILLRGQ